MVAFELSMNESGTGITYVSKEKVCCSGNESHDHPLIYLDLSSVTEVVCPYCSKIFSYKEGADG